MTFGETAGPSSCVVGAVSVSDNSTIAKSTESARSSSCENRLSLSSNTPGLFQTSTLALSSSSSSRSARCPAGSTSSNPHATKIFVEAMTSPSPETILHHPPPGTEPRARVSRSPVRYPRR